QHHGRDPQTAELDPAPGGEALEAARRVAEKAGVEAHGLWTSGEVETSVASSTGVAVSDSVTDAFMKVICIAPSGRSGYADSTSTAVRGIDAVTLAERAARKSLHPGQLAAVPPGMYPVVFEPHAVAALLKLLARAAV